jgi:hypothetical protein
MTDVPEHAAVTAPAKVTVRRLRRLVLTELAFLIPTLLAAYQLAIAVFRSPWQGNVTGLGWVETLGSLALAAVFGLVAGGFYRPFRRTLRTSQLPQEQRRQALGVGLLIALAITPIIFFTVFEVVAVGAFAD